MQLRWQRSEFTFPAGPIQTTSHKLTFPARLRLPPMERPPRLPLPAGKPEADMGRRFMVGERQLEICTGQWCRSHGAVGQAGGGIADV